MSKKTENNGEFIKGLQEEGFNVRVCHRRRCRVGNGKIKTIPYSRKAKMPGAYPLAHGGLSLAAIVKGGKIFLGEAECSLKDNFSYKRGARIALQRAKDSADRVFNSSSNAVQGLTKAMGDFSKEGLSAWKQI